MKRKKGKPHNPSMCFHCDKQLARIVGGFIYALVQNPIGHTVRVHKDCVKFIVGGGYKEIPK